MSSYSNHVSLFGRLAVEPEERKFGDHTVVNFRVAVNRPVAKDKEQTADFIRCVAWDKTADLILKYFKKGDRIGINGSLKVDTYEEDGSVYADGKARKRSTTDVRVDSVQFVEKRSEGEAVSNHSQDEASDDLPF